jgi:hypothetical protein
VNTEIRCLNVSVTDTSNASFAILPALTGQQYTIYGYEISALTADTIKILTGSTQRVGYYFGANSGVVRSLWPKFFRGALGEAVNITKGNASTNVIATIYYVVDNP